MNSPVVDRPAGGRGLGLWLRLGAAALVGLALAYFMTGGRPQLERWLGLMRELGPVWFYAIFVVMSSVGVPTSPFLVVAGASFDLKSNAVGVVVSYSLNLVATYWLGRTVFADLLRRVLSMVRLPWANLPRQISWQVIVMVRLAPGLPYVVQSCFLASVCPRFWLYYLVSAPFVLFMAGLLLFLGSSFNSGRLKLIILAVCLLVVAALALKLFGRRLASRWAGKDSP